MTSPSDVADYNRDCNKAPRVVHSSWGGGQDNAFFQVAVNAWLPAGIIQIFANGNAGQAYKTVISRDDTSMATPHVTGAVALLLGKRPTPTCAQAQTLLTSAADKATHEASGYTCGGTGDSKVPNNQYGAARLNVFAPTTKA